MKRQSQVLLAVAFVAAGAAGCFKDPVSSGLGTPVSLSTSQQTVTLKAGDSVSVIAYLKDKAGNGLAATGAVWTSLAPAIAVVDTLTDAQKDTTPIPANAFTRAVIRGVDSVDGGWTNVIVSSRGIADTIRVFVIPAKFTAGLLSVVGPTLTDTVVVPPDPVSGTKVKHLAYTAGDTLVLNGTAKLAFDTTQVTVSVSTTNGASPGFIVFKSPSQLKVLFEDGTAGKVMIQHLLVTPGNAAIGTFAIDTLVSDSMQVAAWHPTGATFGGSASVAGDTLTVNAGTGMTFSGSTTVSLISASDTIAAPDTGYILSSTAAQIKTVFTHTVANYRVALYNVGMAASGTGVASITFDSLKTNDAAYGIAQATLPASFVVQSGIQLNITAAAPVSFTAATAATFDTNVAVIVSKDGTHLNGVLSPVNFTGPVTVTNAKIYNTVIPVMPTSTSYTLGGFNLPAADLALGAKRLGDTITVTAPAGIAFTPTSAVLLGNRAIPSSDTAWILSSSAASMKVLAKRGGKGALSVTNVDIGAGVIAPLVSSVGNVTIDSVASDLPVAQTQGGALALTIPANDTAIVYGTALPGALNGGDAQSYWTFTTTASHIIAGSVAWFGTGCPYGTGSCFAGEGNATTDTPAYTEDLDFTLCNASKVCDESGAALASSTSVIMPEAWQTAAAVPAAQYWVNVLGFNVGYTIIYRMTVILK